MFSVMGEYRGRACTHLDVDAQGIETAIGILRHVLALRAEPDRKTT